MFESVFLGAVTSRYDTDAVLMAAGITAVITLGLTIFALQTRVGVFITGQNTFLSSLQHADNIPSMHFWTGITKSTQSKSIRPNYVFIKLQ